MSKEQTAVDWLISEYLGGIENCTPDFKHYIKQAKEREKLQIVEAWNNGYREFYDGNSTPEEYYNIKFNNLKTITNE